MIEKEAINIILLNIGHAIHHADWNYKNVSSPFARIYLVSEGSAYIHLHTHVQLLTPGHLYIVPPFSLHSYECDDYFSLYYIHLYESQSSDNRILEDYNFPTEVDASVFDKSLVERLYHINPNRELKVYDPSKYDNSSTLLQNISQHANSPLCTIVETKGILYQLLARFLKKAMRKKEITDDRIEKVVNYIRKNIHNELPIEELANKCYLSKDHFIRLFRKEMHITPTKYINQRKIEQAQLLLITSGLAIKDISFKLAFDDISYFYRLFKEHTGVTPRRYRYLNNIK